MVFFFFLAKLLFRHQHVVFDCRFIIASVSKTLYPASLEDYTFTLPSCMHCFCGCVLCDRDGLDIVMRPRLCHRFVKWLRQRSAIKMIGFPCYSSDMDRRLYRTNFWLQRRSSIYISTYHTQQSTASLSCALSFGKISSVYDHVHCLVVSLVPILDGS